ncbi:MAG TPA: hypothetical protein VFG86_16745, partial [Chloroflexota bacterium]|nr:hypothetical protein [Chloroflexota bacterium]
MNQADLADLVNRHGGLVSPAVAIDPLVANPRTGEKTENNPNPTYLYVFKDGTQIGIRASPTTDPNVPSGFDTNDLQVVEPGTALKAGGGNQPSDPSKWQPVYRNPNDASSGLVGQWDPFNNDFHPIAAAPGGQPSGKFEPVIVTDPDGTQRQVGMTDTGDKTFHPLAAPPDRAAKPTGKFDNVYVTNADGSKRLIGMVDTGDKGFHPIAADPTTQKRTIQTPTAVYSVDDNDNVKKLIDIDKSSPYQAVVIDGVAYSFDPNEKDPAKRFTKAPGDWQHPPIKDASGTPMQWDETQGKYIYPPGVSKASTLNVNTTARTLQWFDDQGNLIKSVENPNYVEQQVQAPAPNAVVPRLLVPDPDNPGKLKWIDNEGQVTASAALQNIASVLSGRVVEGKMTVDEAKTIIDSANTAMQTATTAAGNVLDYTSKGAQTGAGLLQQRAAAAQGMLGQVLGLAGQGQRSGNMGGGLMSAPAGLGEQLVGGIQGWSADLMGGQGTLDAAANMVRSASGGDVSSPAAAAAIGTLT